MAVSLQWSSITPFCLTDPLVFPDAEGITWASSHPQSLCGCSLHDPNLSHLVPSPHPVATEDWFPNTCLFWKQSNPSSEVSLGPGSSFSAVPPSSEQKLSAEPKRWLSCEGRSYSRAPELGSKPPCLDLIKAWNSSSGGGGVRHPLLAHCTWHTAPIYK